MFTFGLTITNRELRMLSRNWPNSLPFMGCWARTYLLIRGSLNRQSVVKPSICHCVPRLQTDANQGGVEKLSISEMRPDFGCHGPCAQLDPEDIAPECSGILPPMAAFMVKGWTRCFCASVVLLCAYESEDFRKSWPEESRQSFVEHLSTQIFLMLKILRHVWVDLTWSCHVVFRLLAQGLSALSTQQSFALQGKMTLAFWLSKTEAGSSYFSVSLFQCLSFSCSCQESPWVHQFGDAQTASTSFFKCAWFSA